MPHRDAGDDSGVSDFLTQVEYMWLPVFNPLERLIVVEDPSKGEKRAIEKRGELATEVEVLKALRG